MTSATYLPIWTLGLFSLALVFYGGLALLNWRRLFSVLIVVSLAGGFFALAEILYLQNSTSLVHFILVQAGYLAVLLVNPFILSQLLDTSPLRRIVTWALFTVNLLGILAFLVSVFVRPELLTTYIPEGNGWSLGPILAVRGILSILNWAAGLVFVLTVIKRAAKDPFRLYLLLGYLILTVGSLLDTLVVRQSLNNGDSLFGFYPGLLIGLSAFHIGVMVALSHSYKETQNETKESKEALIRHKEDTQKDIWKMAYFDDMTDRPNRKSFFLHLNHHIIETISLGKNKAVFFIDLDNFRDVNDTFGYDFGDEVIKNVGEKVEGRLGVRDRLYRFYGNQFAIIWDEVRDRRHAVELATSVINDLTSLTEIADNHVYLGVSIGGVYLPDDGDDVSDVLRRCETALEEAKKDKNTYFFFTQDLESRTRRKMTIVHALREALEVNAFSLAYQPIVDASGRLVELEALVRSSHPAIKDFSPEVFIAVAESSGLVIPLTWWLLERAIRDADKMAKAGREVRVNVNMSTKLLKSRDLVEKISDYEKRFKLSGNRIGFEITESALIENVDQVLTNLKALRERGFRIALDDFGTGYSSLSYIKNLPLDKIKIDKRFVAGISRDPRDEALISSIIAIAGHLKLGLVAEGVEMPNQLTFLEEQGCTNFQGFLFSKPVTIKEIIDSRLTPILKS